MIAYAPGSAAVATDPDHEDAIRRFETDLIAATSNPGERDTSLVKLLRARAIDAYRFALTNAAGRPSDAGWRALARATAAFIARLPHEPLSYEAARAVTRLQSLVAESIDVLEDA